MVFYIPLLNNTTKKPIKYKDMMKQETLEEAAFRFYPKVITNPYDPSEDLNKYERDIFIEGAIWEKERSYSEEEVKILIMEAISSCTDGLCSHYQDFDEWFEENKKK